MKKNLLKTILFLVILCCVVLGVQKIFRTADRSFSEDAFYDEPDNSLDAVYVGASDVYAFWQSPFAWHDFGITVMPYSSSAMPAAALPYVIEECRKSQPNALYVINLNIFKEREHSQAVSPAQLHFLCDYMPFSLNKIHMINELCSLSGIEGLDRLEFFFPIIRFHSTWSQLSSFSYTNSPQHWKGAVEYRNFLTNRNSVTDSYNNTDSVTLLYDDQTEYLNELISYLDEEHIQAMFVVAPQAIQDESVIAQMNTLSDIVSEHGYNVFNLLDYESLSNASINPWVNYYDNNHLNVHGSLKFTHALGQYLQDTYSFTDKRSVPDYESWDTAYDSYSEYLAPYTLDFERELAPRDLAIIIPSLTDLTCIGQAFRLEWNEVAGADSYAIYRQMIMPEYLDYDPLTANIRGLLPWSAWERIAVLSSDDNGSENGGFSEGHGYYFDRNLVLDARYNYTVVPIRYEDNELYYGNFNSIGISGYTTLNPPQLISLELTEEQGAELTWTPMEYADGYCIYRRILDQGWILIGKVSNEACLLNSRDGESFCYTDYYFQSGIPYSYSVGAYRSNEDGSYSDGYYNHDGLLFLPAVEPPVLTVLPSDEGGTDLTWTPVRGAVYSITRMDGLSEMILAENLTELSFHDEQGTETSHYIISAALHYGSSTYEILSS